MLDLKQIKIVDHQESVSEFVKSVNEECTAIITAHGRIWSVQVVHYGEHKDKMRGIIIYSL